MHGDTNAFGELIQRHQEKVLSLCFSFSRSHAEAEDAAQEVFLKAFRGLASFHREAKFSTWLYRITFRHCLDRRRAAGREKTASLDALLEEAGDAVERLLVRAPNEEQGSEDRDLARRVLETLPAAYRDTLVLREMQGLTYEEMAATMGVSLDSVKARLRRARERLRESLRHLLREPVVKRGEG